MDRNRHCKRESSMRVKRELNQELNETIGIEIEMREIIGVQGLKPSKICLA